MKCITHVATESEVKRTILNVVAHEYATTEVPH